MEKIILNPTDSELNILDTIRASKGLKSRDEAIKELIRLYSDDLSMDVDEDYLNALNERVLKFEKNNDFSSKSIEELKSDLGIE